MFDKYIVLPFLASIENFGDNNAFCIDEKFYTYQDLARRISKVRKALQSVEIKSKNIGLVANDDIDTYASIFAIWLEGLAYVPLHPQQPKARSMEIIEQAEIDLVLDSSSEVLFSNVNIICSSSLEFSELLMEVVDTPAEHLAYILFTSGSTGKPKGVPITRNNIGSFLKSFMEVGFNVESTDRCLQCFDLTFDVSIQSFLVPLTHGACTYTIPHDQIKFSYVYGLFEDHKLTFSIMAPSMVRYLRPYFDEIHIESMKYSILTAEASPLDLVEEWSSCIPNAEIYDFYGPTEATIYCTYYKCNKSSANKHLNGMLSIGKAMNGLTAIIIDEDFNMLENNQKGELCISGPQLTPGYWKNPQKNKEAFFNTEFNGEVKRFYRTGDLCYKDDDGDIMYSGRLDYQVKIQGYRIELGEIEYHSRAFLKGQNAVALAFENNTGNTEIALFVEGVLEDTTELTNYIKSKIPYYMVPTKILVRDVFPLNVNGKIDKNKLKELL